jgi:outer membrane protein TolC
LALVVGSAGLAFAAPDERDPLAELRAPGGLTSDEAARRAAASSVEARLRDSSADVAQAQRDGVQAAYWPHLTGVARYTRLSALAPAELADPRVAFVGRVGPPGPVAAGDTLEAFTFPPLSVPVNQYLTQASLIVPLSDYVLRVSRTLAAATRSVRAARIDEQAARVASAAGARLAYYQSIRARAQGLVVGRALAQAVDHRRDAGHLFEAGVATRADTLRAESQVKSAELALVRAENLSALAEERLRVLMHDPGTRPYQVGEDLTAAALPDADADRSAPWTVR